MASANQPQNGARNSNTNSAGSAHDVKNSSRKEKSRSDPMYMKTKDRLKVASEANDRRHRQRMMLRESPREIRPMILADIELYQLRLLGCLQHPASLFTPPSLTFSGLGGATPFVLGNTFIPRQAGNTPASGTVVPIETTPGPDQVFNYEKVRPLNYLVTSGRVVETITATGPQAFMIWFDPWDPVRPLRWNRGDNTPANPFWLGGLRTGGISYPPAVVNGVSNQRPWSNNPFIYATDWVYHTEEWNGGASTPCFVPMYPPDSQYNAQLATAKAKTVFATGYIYYPLSVRMTIDVNHTGFTQTSIRAKTVEATLAGQTTERFLDRIEDPVTGDYGLYSTPVASKHAEFCYRSDRWGVGSTASTNDPAVAAPLTLPLQTSPGGFNYDITSVSNWMSLQRTLADDGIVVEVRHVSSDDTATSDITVNVEVDYALSPTGLVNGMSSHSNVTADIEMPEWFSAFRTTGHILLEGEGRTAIMPAPRPTVAQKAMAEIVAHTPTPEMKTIAAKMPEAPAKAARFVDRVVDEVGKVASTVSKVAEVALPALSFLFG